MLIAKKNSNTLRVATLQPITASTYEENLLRLKSFINKSTAQIIITPELYFTNFDYENFEEATSFYHKALAELLLISANKIIVTTMIKNENNHYVNQAVVLFNHKVIHMQNKHKLFTLGSELKYFKAGKKEAITPFTINGVKYAILICFELRFKALWKLVEGVDVVLIPARWGKSRKEHLEALSRALAIMNQTFVLVSNAADSDMASSSSIISPWGEVYNDDREVYLEQTINLKEIVKVRRLIKMNE